MTLMTIGYEGLDLRSFLRALGINRVATLIDVRELPLSRKRGFSKSAMATVVDKAGIEYIHMRALGCPREVRKEYYEDRDWSSYKKRFLAYLRTQSDALEELRKLIKKGNCCLLCYEADYRHCHRALIAEAMQRGHELNVEHLKVRDRTPFADRALAAA